jgi:hypothetical protein
MVAIALEIRHRATGHSYHFAIAVTETAKIVGPQIMSVELEVHRRFLPGNSQLEVDGRLSGALRVQTTEVFLRELPDLIGSELGGEGLVEVSGRFLGLETYSILCT